jgi:hypothetical protein
MTDLLDRLIFDSNFSWLLIALTLLAIAIMPRLFNLNYINGLIHQQIMLFFNATSIIAGLNSQAISVARGLHFYIIEFSFLALTYAAYRYLLKYRALVLAAMQKFLNRKGTLFIIAIVAMMAVFNYLLAPTDGSSRIAYMTEAWFSLVKPFIYIITPLSYFAVFILIPNRNRRCFGYILLLATVIANIATGSKASFSLGLITAYLAVRDLAGPARFKIRQQDFVKLALFVGATIIFALARLEVSIADIRDRFFLWGEATILTYFSDTPTAACAHVSTFASMHRGLARFLGDTSAQDINTLFGYALTIEELGVNTFTGPNARLSAYMLCNFSDERIAFGAFVILVYFLFMFFLFRRIINRPAYIALIYPFFLTSLASASQDFALIMQAITVFSILLILTSLFSSVPSRHQLG